jgi:hypothetical protein
MFSEVTVSGNRLPRKALGLALAVALPAVGAAPASAATGVRSFRPIAVRQGTMLFRVKAMKPEHVSRVRLVVADRHYVVRVQVVRTALRRRSLVRARLAVAAAASATRRTSESRARLVVYVRTPKKAAPKKTTKKKTGTAAKPSSGTTSAGTGITASGTKSVSSFAPTGPCNGSWGTFAASALPGACWRPYSDSSPFNQPLPANPRLASQSAQMISTMTGWGQPEDLWAGAADTASDWVHPYYFSSPSDPVFTIHCLKTWGTCELEGMQVHIPDAARPAGGGDGHMAVIDQAGGWEYDFWQVKSKPQGGGEIDISWGGRTAIGTPDADGLGSDANAAHYGLLGGIIRYQEIAAGQINHALFLIIKCDGGGIVYPAQGNGSKCADGSIAPQEGSRVFLDMSSAEIDALNTPQWKKAIFHALASYGAFVGDTGGSPWGFEIESGSTYTSFGQANPWDAWAKQQPGAGQWNGKTLVPVSDDGVDWRSRLRVADPCVTQKTC